MAADARLLSTLRLMVPHPQPATLLGRREGDLGTQRSRSVEAQRGELLQQRQLPRLEGPPDVTRPPRLHPNMLLDPTRRRQSAQAPLATKRRDALDP